MAEFHYPQDYKKRNEGSGSNPDCVSFHNVIVGGICQLQSTAEILEYYEEVINIEKKKKKEKEYKQSKAYKSKLKQKELKRQKLTLFVFSVCFISFVIIGSIVLLLLKAHSTILDEEIKVVEQQIEIQESENVRLNAKCDSLFNGVELLEYAEEKLGMVKAEPYQIHYIDLSEGDKIVISGDKVPKQK